MISVIMGTYREDPRIVTEAIESILSQTLKDLELIVILDDPENHKLKAHLDKIVKKDSRIRFYTNDKNLGLANTLNRALSLAKGDYVARMDADDISLPCRLEKQVAWMETYKLDLVGGKLQMIDESGAPIYSIGAIPITTGQIKAALRYGQPIPHPTWLVKKNVYKSLSGYRSVPQSEDYDFLIRAVLGGYRCGNLPEIILRYRMTKNSISRTSLYSQYLYMKYLSKGYADNQILDINKIKRLAATEINLSKEKKYARANELLNTMLSQIENRKYQGFIYRGFRLLFTSTAYLDKIRRFAMMTMIAKQKQS